MKIFSKYRWWWMMLILGSVIVSAITSAQIQPLALLISTAAHLIFAIVVALIPLIIYWLIGRPLNSEQMMATITVGWLMLAIANLSV